MFSMVSSAMTAPSIFWPITPMAAASAIMCSPPCICSASSSLPACRAQTIAGSMPSSRTTASVVAWPDVIEQLGKAGTFEEFDEPPYRSSTCLLDQVGTPPRLIID